MSSDKRREARIDIKQDVWMEGQDSRLSGEATNVSTGGMFVVTEDAPEVGTEIELKFDDPEEGEVAVKMEVVWQSGQGSSDGPGVGLKAMSSAGRAAFDRVVTRHRDGTDADEEQTEETDAVTIENDQAVSENDDKRSA